MTEIIDEPVSVDLLSNHLKGNAYPWVLYWRGRRYRITHVGLHNAIREGRTLLHLFSVTDGASNFRLQLNTETLGWRLLEVDCGE